MRNLYINKCMIYGGTKKIQVYTPELLLVRSYAFFQHVLNYIKEQLPKSIKDIKVKNFLCHANFQTLLT